MQKTAITLIERLSKTEESFLKNATKESLRQHIGFVLSRNFGYGRYEVLQLGSQGFVYSALGVEPKHVLFRSREWARLHRNATELESLYS